MLLCVSVVVFVYLRRREELWLASRQRLLVPLAEGGGGCQGEVKRTLTVMNKGTLVEQSLLLHRDTQPLVEHQLDIRYGHWIIYRYPLNLAVVPDEDRCTATSEPGNEVE